MKTSVKFVLEQNRDNEQNEGSPTGAINVARIPIYQRTPELFISFPLSFRAKNQGQKSGSLKGHLSGRLNCEEKNCGTVTFEALNTYPKFSVVASTLCKKFRSARYLLVFRGLNKAVAEANNYVTLMLRWPCTAEAHLC